MSLRENLLTREIEDLKSKLMIKTDELNVAVKSNSEVRTYKVEVLNNYTYTMRGVPVAKIFDTRPVFYIAALPTHPLCHITS